MKKFDVQIALEGIAEAKGKWAKAVTKFNSDIDAMMTRLLHEAARNYMSAEEVAKASGFTVKRIRSMMRDCGLNPRDGKALLSKKAADALAENAALMGIEPHEMDLTSPLAYLPMGSVLRRELQDKTVSQVTAFPETVRLTEDEMNRLTNFLDFYNRGAESISGLVEEVTGIVDAHVGTHIHDLHLRGGRLRPDTQCPVCGLEGE